MIIGLFGVEVAATLFLCLYIFEESWLAYNECLLLCPIKLHGLRSIANGVFLLLNYSFSPWCIILRNGKKNIATLQEIWLFADRFVAKKSKSTSMCRYSCSVKLIMWHSVYLVMRTTKRMFHQHDVRGRKCTGLLRCTWKLIIIASINNGGNVDFEESEVCWWQLKRHLNISNGKNAELVTFREWGQSWSKTHCVFRLPAVAEVEGVSVCYFLFN